MNAQSRNRAGWHVLVPSAVSGALALVVAVALAASPAQAAPAETSAAAGSAASTGWAAVKQKPAKIVWALPLRGRTVVLDPGHNGGNAAHPEIINALVNAGGIRKPCNTTGTATNGNYAEHAYNFDVAVRAAAVLRARGANVVLTRHSDTGVGPCINRRAQIGNQARAAVVIAIHADGNLSAGARGFHVIEPALAPDHGNAAILGASDRFAHVLRDRFRAGTGEPVTNYISGARDGIVSRADLGGLNLSRVPAVFIECGNMRERHDAANLTSAAWRQKAAVAIADAVSHYLAR